MRNCNLWKLHEVAEEDWNRVFAVNVTGTYLVSKAFLPAMIAQHRGQSSIFPRSRDWQGISTWLPITLPKGAIVNMTRAMAMDYGPDGIRVNSIAPGPTETPLFPADQIDRFSKHSPLGRIVQPEEIAQAVYFAATPASSAMTGENIPITAGFEDWNGTAGQVTTAITGAVRILISGPPYQRRDTSWQPTFAGRLRTTCLPSWRLSLRQRNS
ncbi:MAG: SDR family NAD(P)-dependent oxidoreductase [Limosilactobacillus pontis]